MTLLDAKHSHWSKYHDFWEIYDLLYRGGEEIQREAARFLIKRPKEVPEVFATRLSMFDYQNILGVALGWYQSKLFSKDPTIEVRLKGNSDPAAVPENRRKPYTDFLQNADRNGTTYVDLWRQIYQNLLVFKGCYACIDLPSGTRSAPNRAAQRAQGGLDPYVMLYDPRAVINWAVDGLGKLEWIVIKIQTFHQDFLGDGVRTDRWTYYDRRRYRVYERSTTTYKEASSTGPIALYSPAGQPIDAGSEQTAELVDEGAHALADSEQVPVRYFTIPDGLWLASRAYLPAKAHLNIENSYQWALFMANLPVPVITSDTEIQHTISETAFIQLDKGGKFEWSEPKGTSFEHSHNCLEAKREEIFRSVYLMAQGRSSSASASSSSGYAKEMDMLPSKDVLSAYGDIVRAGSQNLLSDVAMARGLNEKDLEFDVRGFNFEINPALQEAETAEIMISLDIPSDTLTKEMQKRVAHSYLTDANRQIIQQVDDEIDAAPTRDELAAQQQQQVKLSMDRQLGRSVQAVGQSAAQAEP